MYYAVVAGASRGLGVEFVNNLSERGDTVVIGLYRSPGSAEKLLELVKSKKNVHAVKADIADYKLLKEAAEQVSKITGGKLDLLINNGAYNPREYLGTPFKVWSQKEEEFEKYAYESYKVNALGPIHTINAFLPLLRKGTAKKIITINTGGAIAEFIRTAGISFPVYTMTKAASVVATTSFASELVDEGFTVLSISPGVVNTSEQAPTQEELVEIMQMVKAFQKVQPSWNGVPLEPEQSVKLVMEVIERSTTADSGTFVSQYGNTTQWL